MGEADQKQDPYTYMSKVEVEHAFLVWADYKQFPVGDPAYGYSLKHYKTFIHSLLRPETYIGLSGRRTNREFRMRESTANTLRMLLGPNARTVLKIIDAKKLP